MDIPVWARVKLFQASIPEGERGLARCRAGILIATQGKSEVLSDGSVIVRAIGKNDRKIVKGQGCSCDDFKYNKPKDIEAAKLFRCKHMFAASAVVLSGRKEKPLSVDLLT